jgi:hypothetical protein
MYTSKKNTVGGIVSTILGLLSIVIFIIGIVLSYKNEGNAGLEAGIMGLLTFLLDTVGLVLGLLSFKERECFYIFSWIGTLINGLMWIGMCMVIVAGFMTV